MFVLCVCHSSQWRSEDNFQESMLLFCRMELEDQTGLESLKHLVSGIYILKKMVMLVSEVPAQKPPVSLELKLKKESHSKLTLMKQEELNNGGWGMERGFRLRKERGDTYVLYMVSWVPEMAPFCF